MEFNNDKQILNNKNKKNRIIKSIFIFCLFLLLIEFSFNTLLFPSKEYIVEITNYDGYDKIKEIYVKNSFYKQFYDEITILSNIYLNKEIKEKKIIHVSMSLNDQYSYIVLVSMESILVNCNKNETFLIFHILCTPDVGKESLMKIKSLMDYYASNLKIIFYGMGNNFNGYKNIRFSQAAYYRLLLPIIVYTDRIIYLDGDTLTITDLAKMYDSNFDNNYVLGVPGIAAWGLDYLGIKFKNWINDGVLLINSKKIRDDNKCFDLLNITMSGIKLNHDDNTVVNYALFPYIGNLPAKYGLWNFFDKEDIKKYSSFLRQKINISEYEEARREPGVIHNVLCNPKPWHFDSNFIEKVTTCKKRNNCSCIKFHNLWHFYAKKTDYYEEILQILKQKKK